MDEIKIVEKIAIKIIKSLLEVKAHEEVLICTDPSTDTRMVRALTSAIESQGAEFTVAMIPDRQKDKATTITKVLASAMESTDVYIGMTRSSGAAVYNAKMKELLEQKKLRECSMVLRSFDHFIGGAAHANYDLLYEQGKKLAEKWKGKKNCKISTPAGTHLTAEMISNSPIIECGKATRPGQSMAFADGEVSVGPTEGTMSGLLVLDGPICYFGKPSEPIHLLVESGEVKEIIKGDQKVIEKLDEMFNTVKNSRNIAEIGIGLNPNAHLNGDFEEEKKALGTMHIAFGNGIYYGQSVDSQVHVDAVLYKPEIVFDDELITSDGLVHLD